MLLFWGCGVWTLAEVPGANQSYCFESIREITKQIFFLEDVLGSGHNHWSSIVPDRMQVENFK